MIVLLITVTMMSLAALMTSNQHTAMMRTEQLDSYQQIRHDIRSAQQLVQTTLEKSLRRQPVISLDQPWTLSGESYPLQNALLQGKVQDMRGCYNVNVLHALTESKEGKWPDEVERLVDLMVFLHIDSVQARQLTAKLWDFIDSDNKVHFDGGEDLLYSGKDTPYFTANQLLIDISEIRVIDGMTEVNYSKLLPYLCALPDEQIYFNINTIDKKNSLLLQVFSQNKLNHREIGQWLDSRPLGGWKTVDKALSSPILSKLTVKEKMSLSSYLHVDSDYFRFDGALSTNTTVYRWFSLFHWQDPVVTLVLHMKKS